jgi:hypothetical protein
MIRHLAKWIGLVCLFIIGVLLITDALFFMEANARKKNVQQHTPSTFPVLLMLKQIGNSQVIPVVIHYSDFKKIELDGNMYSLNIPPNSVDQINAYLSKTPHIFMGRRRTGHVKVRAFGNGNQIIILEDTSDHDRVNMGCYRVLDRELHPAWHQRYSGPGIIMGVFPMALILNMLLWACAVSIYQKRTGKVIRIWF